MSGPKNTYARYLGTISALAFLYFAGAKLGFALMPSNIDIAAIWPPSGLALAAILMLGFRVWPGIFIGATAAAAAHGHPLAAAACIAAVQTLTAMTGAELLRRLHFDLAIERSRDVFSLIAAATLSTLISSNLGTASLALFGLIPWNAYASVWWKWWASNSLGILIVTPLLLTWTRAAQLNWRGAKAIAFVAFLATVLVLSKFLFENLAEPAAPRYLLLSTAFPLLIWAALQFGQRETILGAVIMSVTAAWSWIHGRAPYPEGLVDRPLLLIDIFIAVLVCTALLLGSITAERRRAEEKFRALLERAPDPLVVVNGEARITLVNQKLEQCFGYTREQLLGQSVEILIPAHNFLPSPQTVDSTSPKVAQWVKRHDGTEFPAEITISPLQTREGTLVTAAIRDVSERHDAQQSLRQAYDELERRVTERTAELAQRNEEKEILLKEIHHRVKNNLQVICSLLNLQARRFDDLRLAHAFADSQSRVKSMALVHEHLYQSQDLARISMNTYVRALVEGVAQTQVHGDRVCFEVEAGDITMPIDTAVPCGLIINEMVTNAFKHAFPGRQSGRLSISLTERAPDCIELVVSDDGVGLPPEQRSASNDSFGLSLVSMLAEQLNASLEVLSTPGTTFRLMLTSSVAA